MTLDGHPTDMQRDSGAGREATAHDRTIVTQGIDGNRTTTGLRRFGSLQIRPDRFAPALLEGGDIAQPLPGANLLRTRRVWISYPHQILWMQQVRPGFGAQAPTPQPSR